MGELFLKLAPRLIWLASKQKQRSFHGGPAFFSTLVGQAGEQELCQESCLHIFRQAPKNLLEKVFHRKSGIFIKGGVSKVRYFQHACQSGPKFHHSGSIHLSAQTLFAVDLHFNICQPWTILNYRRLGAPSALDLGERGGEDVHS